MAKTPNNSKAGNNPKAGTSNGITEGGIAADATADQMTLTISSNTTESSSQGTIRINRATDGSFVSTQHIDIQVFPRTVFVDTAAGTVAYEELFRPEGANVMHLIRRFKDDSDLQKKLADFFRSMRIKPVISSLIKSTMTRANDVNFSIDDYVYALADKGGLAAEDAVLVADMTLAPLVKAGFRIAVSKRFVRNVNTDVIVSIEDLKNDVSAQTCANIMDRANVTSLGLNRYDRDVLAEMVALSLRPIGATLLTRASYGRAVDDITVAIRAKLDIENDVFRMVVPEWLREHPVVDEMSQNVTFLTAAFTLDGLVSPKLSVDTEDLKKYLDVLSASLKSSVRYRSVTLKSVAEEYSLRHGVDYNDDLAFATLAHHVGYEKGAMCVAPVYTGETISFLDEGDSKIAEYLVSHDNGIFDIGEAAVAIHDSMDTVVGDDRKWTMQSAPLLIVLDTQDEFVKPEMLIALATAQSVWVRPTNPLDMEDTPVYVVSGEGGRSHLPNFIFHVQPDKTRRLPMKLRDQMFDPNFVITSDPSMVVILGKSFEAKRSRQVPVQLPDANVLGKQLHNVPADIAQKINTSVGYSIEVGGTVVNGDFLLKSLDAFRHSSSQAILINPMNRMVVTAMVRALEMVLSEDEDSRRELWFNTHVYSYILNGLMRKLSRQFRETVHVKVARAALTGLTGDQSRAMRSALNREAFASQIDLFAFKLYLVAIGCWDAYIMLDRVMSRESAQLFVYMNRSDRTDKKE